MHVTEVMVVAMLAMVAYVSLVEMQAGQNDPPDIDLTVSPDMAHSVLVAYSTLPSKNESVWYSSQLEEWMVQSARDGYPTEDMRWRFDKVFRHGDYRLWVQTETGVLEVHGEPRDALMNTATATHAYNPDWGVTILQPGMSHYNPANPVDIQVLPLLAADTIKGAGEPYTVEATIKDAGGVTYTTSTHGTLRATHNAFSKLQIQLDFVNPADPTTAIYTTETAELPTAPTGLLWPLSLRLQPSDPNHQGIWYTHGTNQRLEIPPGWTLEVPPDPNNWTLLQQEPYLRYQWTGKTHRDADPVWLNLTLSHDDTVPIWRHEAVRAVTEGHHSTSRYLFLQPDTNPFPAPLGIYVSQTDPLPRAHQPNAPYAFHVTNPRNEEVTFQRLVVTFPGIAHWFQRIEQDWALNPPEEWRLDASGEDAVFTWHANLSIPALKSATLTLDLRVDRDKGPVFGSDVMPLLQHVLPDGSVRQSVGALPYGAQGMYRAWFTPNATHLGPQGVRIPSDRDQAVPPGQGGFEMAPAPLAFLDELQEARYSMEMTVEPRVHQPGDPLTVRLDMGDLFQTLKSIDGFQEDTLEVELYSADLWGVLTEQPYLQQSWPLDIGSAAAVTGLEWIDANGDQVEDLLVGYADGNLVALNGGTLPNETVWRIDTPGVVTSGPVKIQTSDGPRLVVAVEEASEYYVYHYTEQGAFDSVRPAGGKVTHLTPVGCGAEPGYGYFVTTYDGGLHVNGGGANYDGKSEGDTYAVRWTPAGTLKGASHTASHGLYLREGEFGPFARCSLLAGYDGGLVEVLETQRMSQTWQLKSGGTIRGLWAEDVRTVPIEDPAMPWFNGNRTDEVLLVTEEHGYEMFTGWVEEARPQVKTIDGLLPGDKFIGLSWVNYTHGYLASERGYVWKSNDAGGGWELMTATPIVRPPSLITDFAFGGDGRGIFVRDDVNVKEFREGGINDRWWEARELTNESYRGLGEAAMGPGVIFEPPNRQEVVLSPWDYGQHVPSQTSLLALSCLCTWATGAEHGLIGGGDGLHTTGQSGANGTDATAGSIDVIQDGVTNANALTLLNATHEREVPVWDGLHPWLDNAKGGRHPATTSLTSANLTTTSSGEATAYHPSADDLVRLSSGSGPLVHVHERSLSPAEAAATQWYRVSLPPLTGPLDWQMPGLEGTFRIHTSHGATPWASAETTAETPWGASGAFVEIQASSSGAVRLEVSNTTTRWSLEPDAALDCRPCLQAIGTPTGRAVFGDQVHPVGPLPRVSLGELDADPVLVPDASGDLALVTRGPSGAVVTLNATTGLPLVEVQVDIMPDEAYQLVAPRADSSGVWMLQGLPVDPPPGNVAFVGPTKAATHKARHIDLTTGLATCSASWSDARSLASYTALGLSGTAPGAIFGSDLGRLRQASPTDCDEWASDPVTTGTTVLWSVDPDGKQLGPHLVRSTIRFGVDGHGTVEIYLLGTSTASQLVGEPQRVLHHTVAISVWFV